LHAHLNGTVFELRPQNCCRFCLQISERLRELCVVLDSIFSQDNGKSCFMRFVFGNVREREEVLTGRKLGLFWHETPCIFLRDNISGEYVAVAYGLLGLP